MSQLNIEPLITRFETVVKHVLYRAKGGNALTAKFVVAHRGEEKTGLIQLGRYAKNFEASKYMVCLKQNEAEWMVEALPALKKNARSVKVLKDPVLLDEKWFDEDRGLKIQAVKVDGLVSKSKFGNQKFLEFVQEFVKEEDFAQRSVTIPLKNLDDVANVFKNLLLAMNIYLSIEQKLEATEHIFMCYLGFLVKSNLGMVMTDTKFNVPLDEQLQAKLAEGKAPMAYWLLSKFISMNFNRFYIELLADVFKTLDIIHFDDERFSENRLWSLFEANCEKFMKAEDMHLFGFTKFLIDNANAV